MKMFLLKSTCIATLLCNTSSFTFAQFKLNYDLQYMGKFRDYQITTNQMKNALKGVEAGISVSKNDKLNFRLGLSSYYLYHKFNYQNSESVYRNVSYGLNLSVQRRFIHSNSINVFVEAGAGIYPNRLKVSGYWVEEEHLQPKTKRLEAMIFAGFRQEIPLTTKLSILISERYSCSKQFPFEIYNYQSFFVYGGIGVNYKPFVKSKK
ncbi:MAG: hypothetical protein GC181_12160 [Bacteroidetes bacterium]|nr:hypothetical protein [Bacteroidota bacterium]